MGFGPSFGTSGAMWGHPTPSRPTLVVLMGSEPCFKPPPVPQEHKVLLTGTPLQNTVEELFSLLHFLEPSQFPSEAEFLKDFGDLKTEEQVRGTPPIKNPIKNPF